MVTFGDRLFRIVLDRDENEDRSRGRCEGGERVK